MSKLDWPMMLADLQESIHRCRDEHARKALSEAVASYNAGAYRGAIVMTWLAVVYDHIGKARILAATGDEKATKRLNEFNRIATLSTKEEQISASQKFESEVIERSKEVEWLTPLEAEHLMVLQADRNKSAHPSSHDADEPYEPTAELARVHMRHAVDALLSKPALQGRRAIDITWGLIQNWHDDDYEKALEVIKDALPIAKAAVVRSLVKSCFRLIKGTEPFPTPSIDRRRYELALKALHELHPGHFRDACEKLRDEWSAKSDDEADALLLLLAHLTFLHDSLPPAVITVLSKRFTTTVDGRLLAECIGSRLEKQALERLEKCRFDPKADDILAEALFRRPSLPLMDLVLVGLEGARTGGSE